MGILAKTKTRNVKAPIPVPSSWAARLAATGNHDESVAKLHGHIHALATTPNKAMTWLEQSTHLKAADMLLRGKPLDKDYLRLVAAPIFVECFFLPSDTSVRRLALPLLQGLFSALGSSHMVPLVQAQLLAFIGCAQSNEDVVEIYRRQTGGQHAHAIELLAGTAYGSQIIDLIIGDIIGFAAAELETALKQLAKEEEEEEEEEGMGSAEALQVRDNCTQAVRLVFLCLSKRAGSSERPLDQDVKPLALARVYELCWDLVGCNGVSTIAVLNSRQVAAMVLVQLIEGSGQPPALRAQTLALHMLDLHQTTPASSVGYLPSDISLLETRRKCMDDAVAMACVARAVISVATAETTLSSLDFVASSRSPGACHTVHEAVFTHIASVCGRSQLAPAVKVLVFDAMAAWLQHTASMLKTQQKDSPIVTEVGARVLLLQRERIMGYLWSYWDDPFDAVQNKVKAIFEAFLDIGSAMSHQQSSSASAENTSFLDDLLDLVLAMDWSRKVKYSLLAALCARISLAVLFRRQPDILECCFETLSQVTMAPRASTLLTAMLERSASDRSANPGDQDECMARWVSPVVAALCKDDVASRRMVAQLVLPTLFGSLPSIVAPVLLALTTKHSSTDPNCRQHALIIVLKAARALDLITVDQLLAMDTGDNQSVIEMLHRAVYHPDWSVRADLLGLLCESRRMVTPLHQVELDLLIKLLRASASTPSADFRQQQHGPLTVLATRLATVAMHAARIVETGRPPVPSQKARHREKARRDKALAEARKEGRCEEQALRDIGVLPADEMVEEARNTIKRMQWAVDQWLDLAVRGCLYPGAGFSKVATGLRWLGILATQFSSSGASDSLRVAGLGPPDFSKLSSAPCSASLTAEQVVTVLTRVLVDDLFDANRASAFALLAAWPIISPQAGDLGGATRLWVDRLLQRALRLVGSTRAGESESGALIIRWVFRKFVVEQGMRLDLIKDSGDHLASDLAFANGLLELIRRGHAAAEKDLLDAAQRHPLHGLLTAAQYVAEEMGSGDSAQHVETSCDSTACLQQEWLAELARVAMGVCSVVLGVLTNASPEGNIPASFRETDDRITQLCSEEDETVDSQVILSYCWRAIKEVSGLLAVIAGRSASDQIKLEIGAQLHALLTSIRHRGAFTAVHEAFTEVCGHMIRSANVELNMAVGDWLDQCLDLSTIRQVSVTRRSAGWPLCLLSVLTCDKLATHALLPRAMDRLLDLASDLQITPNTDSSSTTTDLPQVHAINMLRVLLEDHALAADIVPYVEHAYVLALTGLRSSRWAIRNVCSLLYAALTRRVFGNSRSREETKYDGITGRELFTRFPGLHPFLSNQLEDAVDQQAGLEEGDSLDSSLRSGSRLIHPALYPCLVLLSRLQPSPQEQTSTASAVAPPMSLEDEPLTRVNERNSTVHVTSSAAMLSMYAFTELVELCVDSPVFKAREMAARAFAPLVPSDRAEGVVISLISGLRRGAPLISANSCHGALCQIHELIRVHFGAPAMHRAFADHVVPALAGLWPVLVHGQSEAASGEWVVSDVVRQRYLATINEFVARGEQWIGDDPSGSLTRFRTSALYGSLHPLFADRLSLGSSPQTPGASATLLELTRLLLACIDDTGCHPDHVQYNPWLALSTLLAQGPGGFYEAKLAALDWLAGHAERGRMAIFARLHVTADLLPILVADADRVDLDPPVRASAVRLLALLCARLEIAPAVFPVDSLLLFWDRISAQLGGSAGFVAMSVALALTELQAALAHMLYVQEDPEHVHGRVRAWANQLYAWADAEQPQPRRLAVGRALVAYSAIKQLHKEAVVDAPSEQILRLCYWRALQDDDDEVRDVVASSISRRLGRQLACDHACERLVADFEPNGFPHTFVADRLAYLFALGGELTAGAARARAASAVNSAAACPSRLLFDHEPPNIYVDQSRNMQLAYYSLVAIASRDWPSSSDHLRVLIDGAMCCVEALSAACEALLLLTPGSEATMLPSLYSLVQSWILGARLAVYVATLHNKAVANDVAIAQAKDVATQWLSLSGSGDLEPVHPWIARALHALNDLCDCAKKDSGAISRDRAVSDLFLLTYI
ncbi:hypothetical protein GGI20_004288 [Coemansia sp. BCRC 34301]|nr:hypothetical protein GGI20_004288 [Coemansia sp. BCRC 34301]